MFVGCFYRPSFLVQVYVVYRFNVGEVCDECPVVDFERSKVYVVFYDEIFGGFSLR